MELSDNKEEWTTVSNIKIKSKPKPKQINKIIDKTKIKLWHDKNSWQYNILINNYEYTNGMDVLSKFNLCELHEEYNKAETNYDKNGVVRKLTKILNDEQWNKELQFVTLKIKPNVEIAEPKLEQQNETIDTAEPDAKPYVSRLVDNSISFANMLRKN